MKALWLLTKKNLQILIRSKSSALIVIFAPLLLILILGLSYDTSNNFSLTIGVHATSFSDDVNSFVSLLEEEGFTIEKYEDSVDPCRKDIIGGKVNTCIVLPESLQVEGNQPKEVIFYIDPSRINLVWIIQESVGEKFNLKAQEISQDLSQNLLLTLQDTRNTINSNMNTIGIIKEKSSSASSSASSLKSSLDSVDLIVPDTTYNITSVATARTGVTNAQGNIDQALDALSDSNISGSEKQTISKALNDADDELGDLAIIFASNGNASLEIMINTMNTELQNVKASLGTAAAAIDATRTDMSTVATSLQEINVNIDNIGTSLSTITTQLDSQKVTDASTISKPLTTRIENVVEEGTFLNFLFPALLVLAVMFGSLLLGTTLVMIEKNSPAFIRNYFLPVSKISFISAIYLTNVFLSLIQIVVILGIALLFLDTLLTSIPAVALVLFLAATIFIFLGMIIGYLFASEETAILASISLGSLLLSLSGVLLPLEGLSPILRQITVYNPFVIAEKLIRQFFIFGSSFSSVWQDLLLLVGYAIILFVVIILVETVLHKHFVARWMKHHKKVHHKKKA
ncbi:MAG: ABC transporter permease [archaeon]|nr:ABC transporter permease [archaeon]